MNPLIEEIMNTSGIIYLCYVPPIIKYKTMCGVLFQSIHVWGTGYPVQTSNNIQYQSSKWKWHSVCLFEMRLGALPQMCFANALKKEEEQAVLHLLVIVMQSMWRAFLVSGSDSAASRLDWYFGKSCVLVTVVEHDVVVIILNRWNCFSLVQKTNKRLIVLPRANKRMLQTLKIFMMSGDHENSNKSYQIYKLVINTVPLNKS